MGYHRLGAPEISTVPIDRQQAQRIAELARMDLDPDELSRFSDQLQSILDYVAQLDTLDLPPSPGGGDPAGTGDADWTMGHGPSLAALREDDPAPCLSSETALAPAPDRRDGLFRVPRVLNS
jgi:aspartyl-tRNA(Asn)/glutamyl-tRNA(Gln) amidotransferase subunit C